MEAFAELGGDFVELGAFVDFDGLVGGVEDDATVLAACGVNADLFAELGGELVVEVVGEVAEEIGAVLAGWPSCFCRK